MVNFLQHRWPPLSYELAMKKYHRDYLEEEEEGEGREGGVERGEAGGVVVKGRKKTVKVSGGRDKCRTFGIVFLCDCLIVDFVKCISFHSLCVLIMYVLILTVLTSDT